MMEMEWVEGQDLISYRKGEKLIHTYLILIDISKYLKLN